MCDEIIGDSVTSLELIPDWYVTSKMIKKLYTALYADDNMIYFNENSIDAVFCSNEISILSIDLGNIYLDYNFDKDDI